MPLWSQYRDELNRAPLEHGEWSIDKEKFAK